MHHYYILKEFMGNLKTPSLKNQNRYISLKNYTSWDFPGGPVVRTPGFHTEREQVQSLVGELGSYMPCSTDKNNKTGKENKICSKNMS